MSAVQGGGCNQELKGRCSLIHLQHRKGLMAEHVLMGKLFLFERCRDAG